MHSFRIARAQLGSRLVDVTIVGETIHSVEATCGPGGDFDADGASLVPGLWDHHVHFGTHALIGQCVRLPFDADLAATTDAVRGRLRRGAPMIGFGFRSATWRTPPTAADLDAVTESPVALISQDLHSLWCNTAGLALVGAPRHPTGFLVEDEAFDGIRHLMSTQPALVDEAVEAAEAEAASLGVVGIVDMEMDWAITAWQRRAATRSLRLRVEAATYPERLDDLLALGAEHGDLLAPNLTVGALKIIADGSLGSRTAHCVDPYPTPLPNLPHGRANYAPAELRDLLSRAHAAGLQAAVHAIGDAACTRVLDAFEATKCPGSIEHAQCVQPTDLPRFARLGLVASLQPVHQVDDAAILSELWPTATARAYPMRDLLRFGTRLVLGSDAPVAPLNPWQAIEAATSRAFCPEQALTFDEAVAASTRTLIAPGKPADLVVFDAPGQALLTMNGGVVTHLA